MATTNEIEEEKDFQRRYYVYENEKGQRTFVGFAPYIMRQAFGWENARVVCECDMPVLMAEVLSLLMAHDVGQSEQFTRSRNGVG